MDHDETQEAIVTGEGGEDVAMETDVNVDGDDAKLDESVNKDADIVPDGAQLISREDGNPDLTN